MAELLPMHTDVGEMPVIFAPTMVVHHEVCRVLGLNPRRAHSALNARALEGLRPTSLIFAPGYYEAPGYDMSEQVARRLTAKLAKPVPRIYLTEGQLRG